MTLLGCTSGKQRNNSWSILVVLGLALTLFLGSPLNASTRRPRARTPAADGISYVAALNSANRFLHAWQSGDLESGMVLLSDHARHEQSPERFEEFFASGSERGYEISRGTGGRGRYRFQVTLVTAQGPHLRRRLAQIVVVNTGRNDWAIDKLP